MPDRKAGETFEKRVKAALEKSGDTVATGVSRCVVLAHRGGSTHSTDSSGIWTGVAQELPSEEKLRASATVLAHTPLQMRAMHQLLGRFYDGEPMVLTGAALAAALGVDEAALEQELAPLVSRKTLRTVKDAEGKEAYELKRWDLFLLQLSLAE